MPNFALVADLPRSSGLRDIHLTWDCLPVIACRESTAFRLNVVFKSGQWISSFPVALILLAYLSCCHSPSCQKLTHPRPGSTARRGAGSTSRFDFQKRRISGGIASCPHQTGGAGPSGDLPAKTTNVWLLLADAGTRRAPQLATSSGHMALGGRLGGQRAARPSYQNSSKNHPHYMARPLRQARPRHRLGPMSTAGGANTTTSQRIQLREL